MVELFGMDIGTPAQVATMVFSGGIFGVLARLYVTNRQVTMTAEATLRTHFGEELKRLADEADRAAERQRKCEEREESLRKRVRQLERADIEKQHEIDGLKRQIARYSSDRLTILEQHSCPSDAAPESVKSAPRVKKHTE